MPLRCIKQIMKESSFAKKKQKPRFYLTTSQKALMWERWKKGESLQIAQIFGRCHSSVQGILAETGGKRPALDVDRDLL
jgi:hypothetical protein